MVPLNSYDWNTVTIDAGTLPLSTELTNTSQKVVPTDKAVVWMPFDALKVKRYLLQVKQRDGEFVPGEPGHVTVRTHRWALWPTMVC